MREVCGITFAPFAALVGYDGLVKETARLTDEKIEINKIYVHDSEILFSPVIRLKYNYMSQYDKNTYVVAKWYVGDKLIESYEMTYTPVIDYDLINEDSHTYYGDYSVSLDTMKVKITVYNNFEDKVELDTLEYTLEEIQ